MTDLPHKTSTNKFISNLMLASLVGLSFMVLKEYVLCMVWAVIIAYVLWPIYLRVKIQLDHRDTLSALVMTLVIAIMVTLSVYWLINLLQIEIKTTYQTVINDFYPKKYQQKYYKRK